MAYGLQTWNPLGVKTFDSTTALGGRVFLGKCIFQNHANEVVNRNLGDVIVSDIYPCESKDDIFVYVVQEGPFKYTVETVYEGKTPRAQIQATVTSIDSSGEMILLVFAKRTKITTSSTLNSDYGLHVLNPNNDLLITSKSPVPVLIGSFKPNPFPSASNTYQTNGLSITATFEYNGRCLFAHTVDISASIGRDRIAFMTVPDTSLSNNQDIWYWVDSFGDNSEQFLTVYADVEGVEYFKGAYGYGAKKSYVLPEIYLFTIDNIPSSGEQYGLRVFNSTGSNVVYDSGNKHLNIDQTMTNISFNYTQQSVSGYTATNSTAIVIPKYAEDKVFTQSGTVYRESYAGAFSRTSNVLFTKLVMYNKVVLQAAPPPPSYLPIQVVAGGDNIYLEVNQLVSPEFKPVTATNNLEPYTYSITPALPSGLLLNNSTGYISGTPTSITSLVAYTITVTGSATSVTYTGTATFNLEIKSSAAIETIEYVPDGTSYGCPDPEEFILISPERFVKAKDLAIESVVWTMHEYTKEFGYYKITDREIMYQPKLLFKFSSGITTIVSRSHRFKINDRYIKASNISIGTVLEKYTREIPVLETIVDIIDLGIGPVIRFEIENAHTYNLKGFISHNVKLESTFNRPYGTTVWQ